MSTTPDHWVVAEIIHHQCKTCDECVTQAITLARATGSVGGSHTDGNHGARVERRPRASAAKAVVTVTFEFDLDNPIASARAQDEARECTRRMKRRIADTIYQVRAPNNLRASVKVVAKEGT